MQANRLMMSVAALLVLAGCGSQRTQELPARKPAEVKAEIVRLLPAQTADRQGWATDIYAALAAQNIYPSTQNLCSVLAVTEQESTFQVDPPVPGLGKIAREEIDRRADKAHIPGLLVSGALQVSSSNGKSYSDRLNAARSEKELSAIFDDFIGMVPMGRTVGRCRSASISPSNRRRRIRTRWPARSAMKCSVVAAGCTSVSPTCSVIR
jgi:hypothetical protein